MSFSCWNVFCNVFIFVRIKGVMLSNLSNVISFHFYSISQSPYKRKALWGEVGKLHRHSLTELFSSHSLHLTVPFTVSCMTFCIKGKSKIRVVVLH